MKILFLILFGLNIITHADIPSQIFQLYQKGDYDASCSLGLQHFKQFESNEAQLSLYAFSCLKADHIDLLAAPLMLLDKTQEARANASYFSMLVMQKKLLIQSLYDNTPLQSLKFPTSSHLLSKIFILYLKNPQSKMTIKEYIESTNPRMSYKLYTTELNGHKTVAIDEYYDKILTVHHVY